MSKAGLIAGVLVVCVAAGQAVAVGARAQAAKSSQAKPATAAKNLPAAEIDGLMAPVALYPDQLLAQMLIATTTPSRVADLDKWLKTKPPFKGTALQDAAKQQGFEPSLVALVLFPQVVDFMTVNLDWTTEVGQTFTVDCGGVLDSVQRLRADALKTGKLKSTPQQDISLKTVEKGQQVIVIEPANPQVVYVPQYDSQTVYSQAPTTTTVVIKEESHDNSAAIAAGVIGFTAGIAIGAAIDNDYYYGPYGWHGGPYMYGGAWDDYYDDRQDAREDYYEHREDAREDAMEHREDMADSRSDRASNPQQQRTERQQSGTSAASTRASGTGTATRTQSSGAATQASGQAATASAQSRGSGTSSYEARGQDRDRSSTAAERSGTKSDAFSNYSSGKSERSASARGQSSRSSGGGGRSGGGGGRRR